MSRWAVMSMATFSVGLIGCGLIGDRWPLRPQSHGIAPTVSRLVQELAEPVDRVPLDAGAVRSIAVLGFRDDHGLQTAATRALDEHLLAAMMHNGAAVTPGTGVMASQENSFSWKADQVLPANWHEEPSSQLLSGKLYYDAPWAYLRLLLTEKESGAILSSHVARLTERELARAAAEFTERGPVSTLAETKPEFVVHVDLHVMLWRVSGSFTDSVLLNEGTTVSVGDRMQLRYTTDADCAVWAFLFRSDGVREELIDINPVYAGQDQVTGIFNFDAENIVHTLYFIAAEEIDADRGELFEAIGEWVRRGEVIRFQGIDLIDGKLASFLSNGEEGESPAVVRNQTDIEFGREERFLIGETGLASKPERLTASPVLLRAISFDVQTQ